MSETLAGYRILESLGGGGVADVYRAVPEEGGDEVALKVLRDPTRSRALVHRFLREGRLLMDLRHRGLPRCLEVLREPRPVLVLELLRGRSLADTLREKQVLSPEEVLKLATELLEVLGHLHRRGIIHRDIKSSNVFLHEDGRVLLVDLGLAIDPHDPYITTLGDVLGTYAYMAPEQIAGAGVDQRSDLYSLGITLYEALSGVRPFRARGSVGYLQAHKSGRYVDLSQLVPDAPTRLVKVVHHMMARDPSARPASSGVALALLTGSAGSQVELRAAPLVGREGARGAIEAVLDGGGTVHLVGEVGSGLGRVGLLALSLAREEGLETASVRCRNVGSVRSQVAAGLAVVLREEVPDQEPAIVGALEHLVGEGGFLLLIEDTHQASPATLSELARVAGAVPGLSVVTTGLFAPSGFPGRQVLLRPLTREEMGTLVGGLLGTLAPPAEVVTFVHQKTGGMPGLAVLALRDLFARGLLRSEGVGEDGEIRWCMDSRAPGRNAFGVRTSLRAVLADLPEGSRNVLDVLAVAGEPIPMDVALHAAGALDTSWDAMLLCSVGLAHSETRGGEDWIGVRRPLVASFLVEEMGTERRAHLHRLVARALGTWPQDSWRDDRMAMHQALGSLPRDAAPALLELAAQSLARGEHRRALEHLGVLETQESDDPDLAAEAAVLRGEAHLLAANWQEAQAALSASRKLAVDLRNRDLEARALAGLARFQRETGDTNRCEALVDEVLLGDFSMGAESRLPALAWLLKGECAALRGQEREALRYLRRAAAQALAAGAPEVVSEARIGIGVTYMGVDRTENALRYLRPEVERLRAQGKGLLLGRALYHLSCLERRRGRLQRALDLASEGEAVGRALDLPFLEALNGVARAWVFSDAGDLEAAMEVLRVARLAGDRDADVFTQLQYRILQGMLRLSLGDPQSALAALDSAATLASRMCNVAVSAFCDGQSAVITADAKVLGEAIDVLGRTGGRMWMAVLLLAGANVVGDAATLTAAVREAREARHLPLLLRALYATGGEDARREAAPIAERLMQGCQQLLKDRLEANPAYLWACRLQ